MQIHLTIIRVLGALLVVHMVGCTSSCAPEPKAPPEPIAAKAERAQAAKAKQVESEKTEQRELEDELHERQKALAALASYKVESCAAAIAKMEAALRAGKGHWHERDAQGALAADLLTRLVEAEMWRDQGRGLCASDPQSPRFDELRLLMDAIWRYPVNLPREELDKRLATLGD